MTSVKEANQKILNPEEGKKPGEEEVKKPSVNLGVDLNDPLAIAMVVINVLVAIVYCYGAARLSYNTFGSMGWAVVAFFLAPLYYPYYGIFVSQPTPPSMLSSVTDMIGGRKRRHK
jgi:uncharacterized RDD family membrane protein YckC